MLTPHEIAALMLLDNPTATQQLDPADLNTLIEKQLVQPVHNTQAHRQLRLTGRGYQILDSIARAR